jgi:hypothetical protein
MLGAGAGAGAGEWAGGTLSPCPELTPNVFSS